MQTISESTELMKFLKGDSGRDFLPALPLVASHIESAALLSALRASSASILGRVQSMLDRSICLVAFGSLGRLEYVAGVSDLDPIILVDGHSSPELAAAARSAILKPLAQMNPWLKMDHRDKVLQDRWGEIPEPDIPYPVIGTAELGAPAEKLISQRRWQILLEGRSLFNDDLFKMSYEAILPQIRRSKSLTEEEPGEIVRGADFQELTTAGALFFGGFDNPLFLYKTPFKYFKTRFLRDFFVFGTQLNFLLGWYLQTDHEQIPLTFVRAATVTKMMRAMRFAKELEDACKGNPVLTDHFDDIIKEILARNKLPLEPLYLFGGHYSTAPGRLLHGLLASVLSRFVGCWERIYDPYVRAILESLPRDLNFESRFEQEIKDPSTRAVLDELQQRRDSYRRYMAATASVIASVFPSGRVWLMQTIPRWVRAALDPFVGPRTSS